MKNNIFRALFLVIITINPISSMNQYKKIKLNHEVTIKKLSLNQLPPEIKLHIINQALLNIIHDNDIFDPWRKLGNFLFNLFLTNHEFYSLKNEILKNLKHLTKKYFAPEESKLTQKELDNELCELISKVYKDSIIDICTEIKIAKLIIAGANSNLSINIRGQDEPLLIIASENKIFFNLIKLMILYGTNINCTNNNAETLIRNIALVSLGHAEELVKFILKYKPIVNKDERNNVLDMVILNDYLPIEFVLMTDPNSPYISQSTNYLIKDNAPKEDLDNKHKKLLKNTVDNWRYYDLDRNKLRVIWWFIMNQTDMNIKVYSKDTEIPLLIRISTCADAYFELSCMISWRIDVNVTDTDGNTALMNILVLQDNLHCKKLVEKLIYYGANVNAKNRLGITPLMLAAERGDCGIIRMLLEAGADIDAQNVFGKIALNLANEENFEMISRLFDEYR